MKKFIFYMSAWILEAAWYLLGSQFVTLNFNFYYIIPFKQFLWKNHHCKYENKNFHFLPVPQNSGGCLVPARNTNWNIEFYFLLYYTYLSNSCERTITVSMKIKKLHFLPVRQNPRGCLVPARITYRNIQVYFLLYYTYLSNSCEGTITVSMKIKIFIFYLFARILEAAWCLPGTQIRTLNFIFYYIIPIYAILVKEPSL